MINLFYNFGKTCKIAFCNGLALISLYFHVIRRVISSVLKQVQVFWAVIVSYLINVMNYLFFCKRSSNDFFCYSSVFAHKSVLATGRMIWKKISYIFSSIMFSSNRKLIAKHGTKSSTVQFSLSDFNWFLANRTWFDFPFEVSFSDFSFALCRSRCSLPTDISNASTFNRAIMNLCSFDSARGFFKTLLASTTLNYHTIDFIGYPLHCNG